VTPEAAAYLTKAHELLDEATVALRVDLANAAGRSAYLAGFHAAQALLSTRHDRAPKTHSGVRTEVARQVKDDPRITDLHRAFLARAYSLKEVADYETGPDAHLSTEQATRTIDEARQFVAAVTRSSRQTDARRRTASRPLLTPPHYPAAALSQAERRRSGGPWG
jgi:uncharacterized protein (UPF0332 family)